MPPFVEILMGQSVGHGKKVANQGRAGRDTIPGTRTQSKDKAGGLYPVIECPTKTIQMLEIGIKGIEALTDRALVCRFNGYWPKLADLHSWLDACQKPLLLQTFFIYLCARGFFVIDFDNQEDISTIVEAGPWFQGNSGLFMQHWSLAFNPSTNSISTVPVWVRLPNLSLHLWNDPSLRTIRNAIGQFHNIFLNTPKLFRTAYARICVQMDLSKGLPAELKIVNQDYSWTQVLDCENVSFRCRSCYDIGHQEKEFPKISQPYRHRKATWWTGARPEHYIVSHVASTQHDGTKTLQQENTPETIHEEPPLVASATTLERLTNPRGKQLHA